METYVGLTPISVGGSKLLNFGAEMENQAISLRGGREADYFFNEDEEEEEVESNA